MAEYKEIFGVKADGRRMNSILFRCFKDKDWRSFLRQKGHALWRAEWSKINDMAGLKTYGLDVLQSMLEERNVFLMGYRFYSPVYKTDEMEGICEDGTLNAVRYVNIEANRVFRMKVGKFLSSVIDAHEVGRHFPVQMKTFLCEEFSRDWVAYTMSKIGNLELRTDLTFADIYGNGRYTCHDMGSCMNGRQQSDFYDEFVNATPAALVKEKDGEILARCVIFNEVTDVDNGKVYRLAERQYSKGGDETLKKALIELLISSGRIDGYKSVGAGCGDANAFVLNDGTSISDRCLSISCSISWGDILSYQDSFKWLDMNKRKAYNYSRSCDAYLDSTDMYLGEEMEYDDYHGEYTRNELVEVYYNGDWIYCDSQRLDDFVRMDNGDYYHMDDVCHCDECDEYFRAGQGYYSELLDKEFCSIDCLEDAERNYKEDNWEYSEFDDEYFENGDDVVPFLDYDWTKRDFVRSTISRQSLVHLYLNWLVEKRGDIFYHVSGVSDGKLVEFLNENLAL